MRFVFILAATLLAVISSLAFLVEVFPLTADSRLSSLCLLVPCPTAEPVEAEGPDEKLARLTAAARREPASPYAWCDLGEALDEAEDDDKAAHCMRQAAKLGGAIPSVLIRVAEFHLRRREDEAALGAMSQVLRLASSYDDVVFNEYADNDIPIPLILEAGLPRDARPRQAFLLHSLDWAEPQDASLIWESLAKNSLTTDALASRYADYLIDNGMCGEAAQAWATHLGQRKGPYLDSNWLFNGGFEQPPTGAAFDWRLADVAGAGAGWTTEARSGESALRLTFEGTDNVDYQHVSQIACLSRGQYVFRAWVRSADITTDQAPYFRLHEHSSRSIDVRTRPLQGLRDWTAIEAPFRITSENSLLIVELRRESSLKFDNKIRGTLWIDDVSLERVPTSP